MTPTFDHFCELALERRPTVGLVLGSGLGGLAERLTDVRRIPFLDIPGLGEASVQGHHGALLIGDWAGTCVLMFAGRLHYYEGHAWRKVLEPIYIGHRLGIKTLILTNAAGGISDFLNPGDVMALRDHLEWTRPFWWRFPGPAEISEPRPSPYSPRLIAALQQAAASLGKTLPQGIYAQLTGPCYETPAEIRALKAIGADAVGMSTARETQTAHDLGIECAAVSFITNKAAGLSDGPIHHQEVLQMGAAGKEFLADLVERFLTR